MLDVEVVVVAMAHPMGKLFRCLRCKYNTLDVEYARRHAASHGGVMTTEIPAEVVKAEVETMEEAQPDSGSTKEAPPRRRRAKKEQ